MCGIAGIAIARPTDETGAAVQRMAAAMAHRGPDAGGTWTGSQVVLGHRRLAIIDPGPASHQPMHGVDGRFVLVHNGEVYNYRELRGALAGRPFRTNSDTESLLAAWEAWGTGCLQRLQGMFAFAMWDSHEQELVLVRDRFGEKPLYYSFRDGQLLFASEVRALLASGLVPRTLDRAALADHLRHGAVHGPATMVQDVCMLPPGHLLRWSAGKMQLQRWWSLPENMEQDAAAAPREVVLREVRERFLRSVEQRAVSDVPYGAFLSGGIDSSAVVGALAATTGERLHTFTVTFDEAEYSEARYAALVAKKFGTRHQEIRLKPEAMLKWLPEALAAMDHPSADGPNTWVVAKMAKEAGVSMVLSGLGGDEVFAGYEVFKRSQALVQQNRFTVVPRPLRALLAAVVKHSKRDAVGWKAAALLELPKWDVAHTYPLARLACSNKELRALLAFAPPPDPVMAAVRDLLYGPAGKRLPTLSQVSAAEFLTYLPDTLLRDTDQMAMAHALEIRAPFMDHRLVQYVLGVPDGVKYPHTPKKLLTDALGDMLPAEITQRKKMGFTLPWEHWMRNELKGLCERNVRALGGRPFFRPGAMENLWQRFLRNDRSVSWYRIWTLVALEDWIERNGVGG